MATITAITEHARKPGRYIVDVDGREFAVVGADGIAAVRARLGASLDDAALHQLRIAAAETVLYDRALRLLAARARSAKELRRRLLTPETDAERVDATITRLATAGLLDDAAYSRQVARSKLLGASLSKRRLSQELARRGVARGVADNAIAEVLTDEAIDERDLAAQAARKRLRALRSLDPDTRRRRLYAFLARRGFDGDAIRRAMSAVLRDERPTDVESDA